MPRKLTATEMEETTSAWFRLRWNKVIWHLVKVRDGKVVALHCGGRIPKTLYWFDEGKPPSLALCQKCKAIDIDPLI